MSALSYETGTVIVSETTPSSVRVMVASPNSTSTTSAVHIGFGHEPGGAEGAADSTVKRNEPFLGVARGPLVRAAVVLKL
jgi:hypothetical protein